jgi:hypothetical protein
MATSYFMDTSAKLTRNKLKAATCNNAIGTRWPSATKLVSYAAHPKNLENITATDDAIASTVSPVIALSPSCIKPWRLSIKERATVSHLPGGNA